MEPKLRAWIVFPGGTKFGKGRAHLLRLIEAHGSLKGAVEEMGMSYRAAWGYLRELEAAAGFAFVSPSGSGPSAGLHLTADGRAFLAAFDAYRAAVEDTAEKAFEASFPDGQYVSRVPLRRKPTDPS